MTSVTRWRHGIEHGGVLLKRGSERQSNVDARLGLPTRLGETQHGPSGVVFHMPLMHCACAFWTTGTQTPASQICAPQDFE